MGLRRVEIITLIGLAPHYPIAMAQGAKAVNDETVQGFDGVCVTVRRYDDGDVTLHVGDDNDPIKSGEGVVLERSEVNDLIDAMR